MKEFLLYLQTLKTIVDRYYQKETVFFSEDGWYSRYHSRNISPEELTTWVLELTATEFE